MKDRLDLQTKQSRFYSAGRKTNRNKERKKREKKDIEFLGNECLDYF